MATEYQALPAVAAPRVAHDTHPWNRVLPLALLVPIVFAFGTPVFAFALLLAVLAAPAIVAAVAVTLARRES